MIVVYDIEVYSNFLLLAFVSYHNDDHKVHFEISEEVNELAELKSFLNKKREEGAYFAGFNNVQFDYPLLHYLLTTQFDSVAQLLECCHKKALELITNPKPYMNRVWQPLLKQLDIRLIKHFNRPSMLVSLKKLEFVMGLDSVKDLPFDPTKPLPLDKKQILIDYCYHDVIATKNYYLKEEDRIKFRFEITNQYNHNMINYSDSKIGETIMRLEYEEATGREIKQLRTYRDQIVIKDILFDYISFHTTPFQNMLRFFADTVITGTKSVFTQIEFDKMDAYFGEDGYKKKKKLGKQENLNVLYRGLDYVFGAGGIHASRRGIFESDDEYVIVDVDVKSYYPNLGIVNEAFPAHLGKDFPRIYKNKYDERSKHEKGTMMNLSIKLQLNSVYGKSNSEYSCFYDPQYTMLITINGQLLLAKLAELITLNLPSSLVIQVNTDGLSVKIKRSDYNTLTEVCSKWEDKTGLVLEYQNYLAMYVRDVNNYIAVPEDNPDKPKLKGIFDYVLKDGDHKNHSNLVSKMAAVKYFTDNIDVEEFIRNHKVDSDFYLLTNLKRTSQLMIEGHNDNYYEQRTTRYYVADKDHSDGKLIKVMPPLPRKVAEGDYSNRLIGINKAHYVKVLNVIPDSHDHKFDYDFYVEEAYKNIEKIDPTVNND